MMLKHPKTRKRGPPRRGNGREWYGNLRNQTSRTEKPPEAVVLRRNAVIGACVLAEGAKEVNTSHPIVLLFIPLCLDWYVRLAKHIWKAEGQGVH